MARRPCSGLSSPALMARYSSHVCGWPRQMPSWPIEPRRPSSSRHNSRKDLLPRSIGLGPIGLCRPRRRRPRRPVGRPDRASPRPWRWARPPLAPCRWNRSSSIRTSRGTGQSPSGSLPSAPRPRPCAPVATGRGQTGGRRSTCSGARPDRPSRACCFRPRKATSDGETPADEAIVALHGAVEPQTLLHRLRGRRPTPCHTSRWRYANTSASLAAEHQPGSLTVILGRAPRPIHQGIQMRVGRVDLKLLAAAVPPLASPAELLGGRCHEFADSSPRALGLVLCSSRTTSASTARATGARRRRPVYRAASWSLRLAADRIWLRPMRPRRDRTGRPWSPRTRPVGQRGRRSRGPRPLHPNPPATSPLGRLGSVMRAWGPWISTRLALASLASQKMPPYCQTSGISLSNSTRHTKPWKSMAGAMSAKPSSRPWRRPVDTRCSPAERWRSRRPVRPAIACCRRPSFTPSRSVPIDGRPRSPSCASGRGQSGNTRSSLA